MIPQSLNYIQSSKQSYYGIRSRLKVHLGQVPEVPLLLHRVAIDFMRSPAAVPCAQVVEHYMALLVAPSLFVERHWLPGCIGTGIHHVRCKLVY